MSTKGSCESRIRAMVRPWVNAAYERQIAAVAAEADAEIARLTAALRGHEPPGVAAIADEERADMLALEDDYDAPGEHEGDEGGTT